MVVFLLDWFGWFRKAREYERQLKIIDNMFSDQTPLSGLSFSQRRRYSVLYNDTYAGAFRQFGKARRRLVNELFSWMGRRCDG